MRAGTWMAAGARRALLNRKRAEAPQFDAIAARHRRDNLAENGVDDILDVALIQMGVLCGDPLHQFRLDHCSPRKRCLPVDPARRRKNAYLVSAGCQRAKRPSRLKPSIAVLNSRRSASALSPTASSSASPAACRKERSLKRLCRL